MKYTTFRKIYLALMITVAIVGILTAVNTHAAEQSDTSALVALSITSVSAQAPTASTTRAYDVTLNDGSALVLDVPVLQPVKPQVGPCERKFVGGFLGLFQHEAIVQGSAEFAIR